MNAMTRKIILLWLCWAAIIFVYQEMVPARFDIVRPDYAVPWTYSETLKTSQMDKPFLIEPFLNTHVSWDSEFYVQQTVSSQDDDRVRKFPGPGPDGLVSMSYAFYPLYAYVSKLVAFPLQVFGLTPIATATLATLIVSLLGTLAGMLALADLAEPWLYKIGGLRAAFYMLIFPSGFFLAQVYTEGLFVGLAFTCLALIRREKLLLAGVLAVFAVWTRAVGIALCIPLAWAVFEQVRSEKITLLSEEGGRAVFCALLPLGSFAMFWFSPLGERFRFVEDLWFGRGFLLVGQSITNWGQALSAAFSGDNTQALVYNALELAMIAIALVAALALLRKYPGLALFSLAVWIISVASGSPQSISRYLLVMPTTYIGLARLGKNEIFDRAWTLGSVLVMGLYAALFSFDMWVG